MTDLYNGELMDMLNGTGLMGDAETRSISHALHKGIQMVIDAAKTTMTGAAIDAIPERVLDALAVELRSPYYLETLPIPQKREIVKRTLIWHHKAGTPEAVRELVGTLFGGGDIVEWFDFDEGPFTPGTFDIVTDARMTRDTVERFLGIVERVKNARSHLRRVLIRRDIVASDHAGGGAVTTPGITVTNNKGGASRSVRMRQRAAVAASMMPTIIITNSRMDIGGLLIGRCVRAASGAAGIPRVTITNHRKAESRAVAAGRQATAATASPEVVITNHPGDASSSTAVLSATAGAVTHPHITI